MEQLKIILLMFYITMLYTIPVIPSIHQPYTIILPYQLHSDSIQTILKPLILHTFPLPTYPNFNPIQ